MRRKFGRASTPGDWAGGTGVDMPTRPGDGTLSDALIIACTDSSLDYALARLEACGALIWRTQGNAVAPECNEGDDDAFPLGPLSWAGGARDIVVLGHSRCEWVKQRHRQAAVTASGLRENGDGMARVVRNLQEAQRLRKRAMEHVLGQLDALGRHPELADAVASGEVCLHGLLYLDETDTFLRYDAARGLFVPEVGS